ncbi:Eisosome 1 protein [Rutstroemia sp. NJR-2017a WRK4]|nr:Eisosome 1 protein [Rutstroemia sp. NJR-2017a WRK4]
MATTSTNHTGGGGNAALNNTQHTSSNKLEDQAATAALYVTKQNNRKSKQGLEFLDGDNRLSSAGAAASLKYARPQDLPSFPSVGLKRESAAGAAASIGWQNQKPFEHWKPDPSASASAAAMLAKDYKMAPLWQPEASSHGAKAALLAHKAGGKVDLWQPQPTAWGNSAATQAMQKGNTLSPQLDYGHTDVGRKGSLLAATGAMSKSRKRSDSTPVPTAKAELYPDEANAASNALKAAISVSNKNRTRATAEKGGASPVVSMPREMFTSHPPVRTDTEDQNRNDVLKASAVAMAKKMYNQQQKQLDDYTKAQAAAAQAHGRRLSVDSDDEPVPMRLNNLQEAAQKLAQQRLSKLHDEHAQAREYRDYYASPSQPTSRLSIRGRTRVRASSFGSEDQEQSNRIRAQMSMFSSNISQIDDKKRQRDREALLAAAQRNVNKSLHGMDERVFAETGKVAPSLLDEWELKAHAAAQAKSEARMENYGKVDIGGGKFVDRSIVEAAAAKNVQPVLDELNEKAEVERERQAALQLERDTQRRKAEQTKVREKESKEIAKKLKQQEKDEEKMRKAEEKAAQKEQRKSIDKRKSLTTKSEPGEPITEDSPTAAAVSPTSPAPQRPTTAPAETSSRIPPLRTSMEDQASLRMRETALEANAGEPTPLFPSPTSPESTSKVRNWLKNKLHKRSSRQKSVTDTGTGTEGKGFVGGAALTGASANNSTTSLGRGRPAETEVSSVSEMSEDVGEAPRSREDEFQEARDNFDEDLAPPPTFAVQKSSSPVRVPKFHEEI